MRWTLLIFAVAVVLAGCERRTLPVRREEAAPGAVPDAGGQGPIQVPTGCERSLAGRYRLAGRTDFRYAVSDDGRQIVAQLDLGDAGPASARMVLERTAHGFVGEIRSSAKTAAGRDCPVAFRAEVIACDPAAFTVRSWDEVSIDEQCQVAPAAGPAVERTLLRE